RMGASRPQQAGSDLCLGLQRGAGCGVGGVMAWERGRGEGVLAPQGLMLMGAYVLREARIDTSRPPTYKGAMERDENGNLLCPVCHETIHDPDRRPFMGDRRVH